MALFAKKDISAEEEERNRKLACEYDIITITLYRSLLSQNIPFVREAEVQFGTESIRIDFIAFHSSPIFFYMTIDPSEPETQKIKKYCNDANIKLIVYCVKLDNTNLITSYSAGVTLLLTPGSTSKLVVC